ncbi:DNA polymerase [Tepidiforma thermophila]|uniref:Type-4 uracil-DNA glycosylase n=1 Tax=Tepidiforma thermophila (strain KCTC 52669 / CGMCC 1.13589 / G233) TaxID=2761530 RepID=A0A2A9HDY3_TEPT2|nr:uracil-DNA glycosylase [Tepidiforma thermophila]PFG74227.1 DNA polymerase [Tepidiforma thermophila]
MISKEERAAELYEVIRACRLCALAETRTHAVPGEGPLDAEVMCIGEAPGLNEDRQGRPFVGAAGQFLTELLAEAGLRRDEVYICNVLKCRPPGNRDPLPGEIAACAEYLDLQIDLVDPLVIVTLGRFSMARWFPQQTISRIHGKPKVVDGRYIVPMYHPAAALHQGALRQVLVEDFRNLRGVIARARRGEFQDAGAPAAVSAAPEPREAPGPGPGTRADGPAASPTAVAAPEQQGRTSDARRPAEARRPDREAPAPEEPRQISFFDQDL